MKTPFSHAAWFFVSSFLKQGNWTEFYNLKATTGQNAIVAFTAGDHYAGRAETMSTTETQTEIVECLEAMFGVGNVPVPSGTFTTKWKSNEFARGSYSYYKVGSGPRHRNRLAEPVANQLYFAGEACHLRNPSTISGAYETGEDAANAILAKLEKDTKEDK